MAGCVCFSWARNETANNQTVIDSSTNHAVEEVNEKIIHIVRMKADNISRQTNISTEDDVAIAVLEFQSELDAKISREEQNSGSPIGLAALSRFGHGAAAAVLGSRREPHWSLLGALSQSFEEARKKVLARSESLALAVVNATLSAFEVEDDNPLNAEAAAIATLRARLGPETRGHTEAERALVNGLRRGALRSSYVKVAESRLEAALKERIPAWPVSNATLDVELRAATGAVDNQIPAEATQAAALVVGLRARERNQVAALAAGRDAVEANKRDLETCLDNAPLEALLGLGHSAALTVCEAEASMSWIETLDTNEFARQFVETRRAEASKLVAKFRDRATNMRRDIEKHDVSTARLEELVDERCPVLPVDDVKSCGAQAKELIQKAAQAATDVARAIASSADLSQRFQSLEEYLDQHLRTLSRDNDAASAKCVADALAVYSVAVADFVTSLRRDPLRPPPAPRPLHCRGPAAVKAQQDFDKLADALRDALAQADKTVKTVSHFVARFSLATAILQLIVLALGSRRPPAKTSLGRKFSSLLSVILTLLLISAIVASGWEVARSPPPLNRDGIVSEQIIPLVSAIFTLVLTFCCCCCRGRGWRRYKGDQPMLLARSAFRNDDHVL